MNVENKNCNDPLKTEMRLLLLDTNCVLRIYQSALRPILGSDIGKFRIRTLLKLIDEFRNGNRLRNDYAWATMDITEAISQGALLTLQASENTKMLAERNLIKRYGNHLLEIHCTSRSPPVAIRSLSTNDATLIATATVLNAVIASDEWPMTLVVHDLITEDAQNIEIWNSFDLLALLQAEGKITAQERRDTVISWLRNGEALPRAWHSDYRRLFNEPPPTLQ